MLKDAAFDTRCAHAGTGGAAPVTAMACGFFSVPGVLSAGIDPVADACAGLKRGPAAI